MTLQRAARERQYKLLLDDAVQSRRPDMMEFGGLPSLALLRDNLAAGTALLRCRDHASAPKNAKHP
jgi:hypothetical protein